VLGAGVMVHVTGAASDISGSSRKLAYEMRSSALSYLQRAGGWAQKKTQIANADWGPQEDR